MPQKLFYNGSAFSAVVQDKLVAVVATQGPIAPLTCTSLPPPSPAPPSLPPHLHPSPPTSADEERTWNDTAEEEAEIKLELSEMLWDDLLTEAAEELLVLSRRAQRRRSGTPMTLQQLRAPRVPPSGY